MNSDSDLREAHEKCGVVGVSVPGNGAAPYIYLGLRALQHRGQESAGMATCTSERHYHHKGMGLVHEVFNRERVDQLRGAVGIGHVRYATTGRSTIKNAQPVVVQTIDNEISLAHNGDIVNFQSARRRLKDDGTEFLGSADTEVFGRLIATYYSQSRNMVSAIRKAMSELQGAYAIVMIHGSTLYAFRDPNGIRPMSFGKLLGGYAVASESVAIELMSGEAIRDVAPGEIIRIEKRKEPEFYPMPTSAPRAHCMFEWVYFARADSVIDGSLVYRVRNNIGKTLAVEAPVEADIVVPVPSSSRPLALGYAHESGVPYTEALVKSRFVERTFILPDQKMRQQAVRMKLHPIKEMVNGKRVVLLDDSIVRGTTLREIVNMMRQAGAKEVHLRIGCPAIIAPCYFGIDMKERSELVANQKSVPEIAKMLGANSLHYVSIPGLIKAIGIPDNSLCLGCITAKYPLNIPEEQQRFQKALNEY